MKRVFASIVTFAFLLSAASLLAADYQGADKCSMCHKRKHAEHYTAMSEHAHMTTAWGKLSADEQKKAECVVCHTTGFGDGGYEIKDAAFWANDKDKEVKRMAGLQMVGCEACHSDLAVKANYNGHKSKEPSYTPVKPTAETCKKCHNEKSPTFKPLNFAEEMKKFK